MSSHEAYLRSALSKYQYPDIAKRDILNAFQSFCDLRPKLDTFVFNDGSRKELLCLEGTIPVTYKGNTYNIPVCLWLSDSHPYNPPMVYVRPTQTMQIKPGRHVDANGRIYLPYLHEWKHPQSDLLGMIQVLTIIFGEDPPVFSRGSSSGQRPAYPGSSPGAAAYPGAAPGPSGGLPYPSQQGSGMPVPSYPGTSPSYQPPTSYSGTSQYPGYPAYPSQSQSYPNPPTAQPPYYPGYPASTQSASSQGSSTTTTSPLALSNEQIRASLLSAVEDKMRRRLKEIFAQAQAEMDVLKRTQDDLQKGKQTLEDMLQRLEREQNEVERNITLLQEKDDQIKTVLGQVENREEVDIDDAVIPTAPLYRQLLNAFAEEQATEDAIYYLQEGLKRGVIDLEVFLKQVRELSRKQFLLRALILRCRQKAGLPETAHG